MHFYNSTSRAAARGGVRRSTRTASSTSRSQGARLCRKLEETIPDTDGLLRVLARSPTPAPSSSSRSRSATQVHRGLRARRPDRKVIINLPATVEMATPNVYADSIEWMRRHLDAPRERRRCRLHPHNDRGTGVAAAELGYLAGADRIEGCLFGNGERTGNVDLVTLGMNLFTPGHRPADRLQRHRRGPAHRRVLQPAAGARAAPVRRRPRLHRVLRLAPGRHQEGLRGDGRPTPRPQGKTVDDLVWAVPYLPIDPKDVGRTLRGGHPGQQPVRQGRRRLPAEGRARASTCRAGCRSSSAGVVQAADGRRGRRGHAPADLWAIFQDEYLPDPGTPVGPVRAAGSRARPPPRTAVDEPVIDRGRRGRDEASRRCTGPGNGPIAAFVDALATSQGVDVRVLDYAEHALSAGGDARPRRTSSAPSASGCCGASASTRASSPRPSRPWCRR